MYPICPMCTAPYAQSLKPAPSKKVSIPILNQSFDQPDVPSHAALNELYVIPDIEAWNRIDLRFKSSLISRPAGGSWSGAKTTCHSKPDRMCIPPCNLESGKEWPTARFRYLLENLHIIDRSTSLSLYPSLTILLHFSSTYKIKNTVSALVPSAL